MSVEETKVIKKKLGAKKKLPPTNAEQLVFLAQNEVELHRILAELKIEVTKIPAELRHVSKCAYEMISSLHNDLDELAREKAELTASPAQ